jgi:hypothetical protein
MVFLLYDFIARHIAGCHSSLGLCVLQDLGNLGGKSHAATSTSDVMLVLLLSIASLYNSLL